MQLHGAVLSEGLAAQVALEWSLTSVGPKVPCQVPTLSESLPTVPALERPLPSVHPMMRLQCTILVETHAAELTPEWPLPCRVHLVQMLLQAATPCEGLVAMLAPVRLWPKVCLHVLLQILLALEALATVFAFV